MTNPYDATYYPVTAKAWDEVYSYIGTHVHHTPFVATMFDNLVTYEHGSCDLGNMVTLEGYAAVVVDLCLSHDFT